MMRYMRICKPKQLMGMKWSNLGLMKTFSYIDDYMMRHPKTGKPVDQLPPVKLHKLIVRVECGDLLRVKCDAVVSSANPNLSGTGKLT